MSTSAGSRRASAWSVAIPAFALAAVALLGTAHVVHASDAAVSLAITPIDQPGSYFEVSMVPGETRTLAVELANHGNAAISTRTYRADVYTIVNGGFGARLHGEPADGTTLWLDYPDEILQLTPGEAVTRSFTVSVPADATSGEYIASVVLENAEPVRAGGSIALDQVIRQAVAVVVVVPGPQTPGLALGPADHMVTAGRSVVRVALSNTGNVRLRLAGEFVLADGTGSEVSRSAIVLDSVYAGATTSIEVPLADRLSPGPYTVRLSFADRGREYDISSDPLPLSVLVPTEPDRGSVVPPKLEDVIRAIDEIGLPVWLLSVMLVSGLLSLTLILAALRIKRRRQDVA